MIAKILMRCHQSFWIQPEEKVMSMPLNLIFARFALALLPLGLGLSVAAASQSDLRPAEVGNPLLQTTSSQFAHGGFTDGGACFAFDLARRATLKDFLVHNPQFVDQGNEGDRFSAADPSLSIIHLSKLDAQFGSPNDLRQTRAYALALDRLESWKPYYPFLVQDMRLALENMIF